VENIPFSKIDSFEEYLKNLSLYQFREVDLMDLLKGFCTGLDELQEVFIDLLNVLNIDEAEGYNLNLIGKIVGFERVNQLILDPDDETYRSLLKRRIALNNNSGEPNSIISGVRFIYDIPGEIEILISFVGNANYVLFINYELVNPDINDFYKISPAGVGVDVVYGSGDGFRYGTIGEEQIESLTLKHGYSQLSGMIYAYTYINGDIITLQNGDSMLSYNDVSNEYGGSYRKLV